MVWTRRTDAALRPQKLGLRLAGAFPPTSAAAPGAFYLGDAPALVGPADGEGVGRLAGVGGDPGVVAALEDAEVGPQVADREVGEVALLAVDEVTAGGGEELEQGGALGAVGLAVAGLAG